MIGARPVWGIDIGSFAVKGVMLLVHGDGFEITDFDVLPHKGDPDPIDGPFVDRRAYRTLALFQERHRIRTEHVTVAVPGRTVFSRPVEVIEVTGKPLEELVRFEVQQHVGIDLDSVLWDYELFPREEAGDERRRRGILFAMKKAEYNTFIRGLDAARITVDDVQTAPLALCNYVRFDVAPDAPILALDVGASSVNVVAIYGARYWTRTVNAGANLVTAAIQREFNVDYEKAEALKVNAPQSKHSRELLQRMLPAMRALAGEVQNALNLLRGDVPGVTFQRMHVLGGGSRTLGLCRLLEQQTGIPATAEGAFARIPLAEGVDARRLAEAAPGLAVAAGLAVQGAGKAASKVSLVSAGTVRGKHLARSRPFAIAALAMAAVLVAFSIYFGYARRDAWEAANTRLDAALSEVNMLRRTFAQVSKESPDEARLRGFHTLGRNRDAVLGLLNYLGQTFAKANAKRRMWIRALDARPVPPTKDGRTRLDVRLEGMASRIPAEKGKPADDEKKVWFDVSQSIDNALKGWPGVIEKKGDITSNTLTDVDGTTAAADKDWAYVVFFANFIFTPASTEKEPPR